MDFDPRDYDSRDEERFNRTKRLCTISIAMTTSGSLTIVVEVATMTHASSVAVLATRDSRVIAAKIRARMRAGPSASAITIRVRRSRVT